MNYKISVIVPVYNVEVYLSKCLESIIGQSYKNLELIIINDGSTDNSGILCDYYAKIDNRVVAIHKENAGVSAARNDGIELAKGEYICFIDGDDWIEKDYFETAIKDIAVHNPDCLINNFVKDFGKGRIKNIYPNACEKLILNRRQSLMEMFRQHKYGWVPFATFYKASLLKKVRFDVTVHFGEDLLFKYQFLNLCDNGAVYSPLFKYHYVFRENSAVNSYSVMRRMDDLKVARDILKSTDKEIADLFFRKCYCSLFANKCRLAAYGSLPLEKQIAKKIREEIRCIITKVVLDSKISWKIKCKLLVCLLPDNFVIFADRIYQKIIFNR